ncbi:MAG: hypothetical protein FWG50_14195 [Kiritimatiellaeota bacterium]|nr:hypothetical protein [Kiritimatiellota bacterium]
MMTGFSRTVLVAAGLALAATVISAATPQEEAFLKVWRVHAADPARHAAVIEACQSVMDRASTLGEYLPAVMTLAGWHLLASGKEQEAIDVFQKALTSDRGAPAIARSADTLARRWLTRLDHAKVEKGLRTYYAANVAFPTTLSPVFAQPNPPPKADRFGDAWVYETKALAKVANTANQRFSLHSKTLGNRLTALKSVPFTSYGKRAVSIVSRRAGTPVMVEFETVTDAGAQRGTAGEGSAVNGVRFLKLSSDGQFALMIENENDFWVVATAGRR